MQRCNSNLQASLEYISNLFMVAFCQSVIRLNSSCSYLFHVNFILICDGFNGFSVCNSDILLPMTRKKYLFSSAHSCAHLFHKKLIMTINMNLLK